MQRYLLIVREQSYSQLYYGIDFINCINGLFTPYLNIIVVFSTFFLNTLFKLSFKKPFFKPPALNPFSKTIFLNPLFVYPSFKPFLPPL